ncbi:unnamed protein product [Leptosia nina]|uniref:Uncharacterized protein n=1 Tax=Leptosia nina TaxID=320188 RepID=A0AAV1JRB8_9NEOP
MEDHLREHAEALKRFKKECMEAEYIYPGLKLWRQISIPLISVFPRLTDLHQETCLLQNPFFTVVDMDCSPCSNVQEVRELQDPILRDTQHATPLTYKTTQLPVSLDQLHDLYVNNKKEFDAEGSKILVNNRHELMPKEWFSQIKKDNNLYMWKINTLNSARILRQLIPRPKIVPKFGQASERFIIVDTQRTHFEIPDTECNYSFLLALSGKRTILLKPAQECKHLCKSLKIDLMESQLLWYNWWYWRPLAEDAAKNETFISQLGSYC